MSAAAKTRPPMTDDQLAKLAVAREKALAVRRAQKVERAVRRAERGDKQGSWAVADSVLPAEKSSLVSVTADSSCASAPSATSRRPHGVKAPCKFFEEGRCHFGRACRFEHPVERPATDSKSASSAPRGHAHAGAANSSLYTPAPSVQQPAAPEANCISCST